MSLKQWEKKVLEAPGAPERVQKVEDELRRAAGLTALREQAGLTQRELAERIGVSQPRIAAIERARNVTIEVLEQYVQALGGRLELTVIHGRHRTSFARPQGRTVVEAVTGRIRREAAIVTGRPAQVGIDGEDMLAALASRCSGDEVG